MSGLLQKLKIASRGLFLTELVAYAGFVLAYYVLVLHFLGDRLKQVFDENRIHYAILALALIVVQGVFLEMLTSRLLRVIRRKAR
jgi:hypothetical protein